jgi:hypothetical protein
MFRLIDLTPGLRWGEESCRWLSRQLGVHHLVGEASFFSPGFEAVDIVLVEHLSHASFLSRSVVIGDEPSREILHSFQPVYVFFEVGIYNVVVFFCRGRGILDCFLGCLFTLLFTCLLRKGNYLSAHAC